MVLKRIVLVVVVVATLIGGFLGYWYIRYASSPDKVANDVVSNITAGNVDAVFSQMTVNLQAGGKEYWQTSDVFTALKGYKGNIRLINRQRAVSTDKSLPDPYPAETEAWRFTYSLMPGGTKYRLSFDLLRVNDKAPWQIGTITGDYEAS